MSTALWSPTSQHIIQTNLYKFIQYVNNHFNKSFNEFHSLYAWSIQYPEDFWKALWNFFEIKRSQEPKQILLRGNDMKNTQWFLGAKLNFTENLLSRNDKHPAIIFKNELEHSQLITYEQLNILVFRLANAFLEFGIRPGDRIVGILPNIPEAIISMLATTSIGAIWSSCSPDFGAPAIFSRLVQIEPQLIIVSDGYIYKGKTYFLYEKLQEINHIASIKKAIIVPYVKQSSVVKLPIAFEMFDSFISKNEAFKYKHFDFAHPVYILFSSGTTGKPKCITHGAGGTLLQHLKELKLHTNLKRNQIIFFYTTCGWMMWNWLASSLAVGATLVLYDGHPHYPKTDSLLDLIDELNINVFGISATYIHSLLKHQLAPKKTHKLTSLHAILSTGSPLSNEGFRYIYSHVKSDVMMSSISGGTDIISCFALGNPMLPVYEGELQCRGLGMNVEVYNELGQSVINSPGELVCVTPFPSMPIYFWNDPNGEKYHQSYFTKYSNVWAHGDYAKITLTHGLVIYGRSDSTLKPGGVRIGTAEIYQQLGNIPEVVDGLAVNQHWKQDIRIILFVKLIENCVLTEELIYKIKSLIRMNTSPKHVPAKVIQINEIPTTINGKKVEIAVYNKINGFHINNTEILINPHALAQFENLVELLSD